MGRKAVRASTICARRLPRSLQGQRKESLSCCGEGFTLWREVLKIMEIALKWLSFLWVRVLSCALFCRIAGGFEGKSGVFLQSYSATKFGLHFCFLRSFFILPRRYFLRGGVWLNFFAAFFAEISRCRAARRRATFLRPCALASMKKALQTTKVAGFCLAPFLLLLFTAIPGVFIVHAVEEWRSCFFPLSPKKRKIFIFGAKLKILP